MPARPASLAGPPLALTMGDPAGIGLEIALLAWRDRVRLALPPMVLFACPDAVAATARRLAVAVEIAEVAPPFPPADGAGGGERLAVVPVPLARAAVPGRPAPENAAAVIAAIRRAVAAVRAGDAAAVVTSPIAKSVLTAAGFAHPGHTEFLAALAGEQGGRRPQPVMMLACDTLRVVPLTVHVPLARVPGLVTADLVASTARITAAALASDFGLARARIAVAGLNPHAGESGTIGTEERDVVAPAIEGLRREGLDVLGPLSADTLFHAAARASYDAVIAMYHDQALIPIKTLAFDSAVNVTLGLPFVRTSPDHGTAFDIAGTGRASPASLVAAIRLAAEMALRRAAARAP
jgi:4-hydroxythreonine-4-phosphate dehydrogenase